MKFTKAFLTTPIKVKITQAKYMCNAVYGIGYSKSQFSPDEFKKQVCRGRSDWYADKIGEVWDVLPFSLDFFRVNNRWGCGFFFIHVLDCTIIKELGPVKKKITIMNKKTGAWRPIKEFDLKRKDSKCIVTNNIDAVDANGQMSHIWIVTMIHKEGRTYSAFNDALMPFPDEIMGITHFRELPTANN